MKKVLIITIIFSVMLISVNLYSSAKSLNMNKISMPVITEKSISFPNYKAVISAMDFLIKSIDFINNLNNEIKYDYIPFDNFLKNKTVLIPFNDFAST